MSEAALTRVPPISVSALFTISSPPATIPDVPHVTFLINLNSSGDDGNHQFPGSNPVVNPASIIPYVFALLAAG